MEVVDILPESLQVAHLLAAMNHRLRDTIALKGIPRTREELILEAHRVEELLGPRERSTDRHESNQNSQTPNNTPSFRQDSNQTSISQGPLSSSEPTVARKNECYKCGKAGHSIYRCPKTTCYSCHEPGHIATHCPQRRMQDINSQRVSRTEQ